jgi:putative heme-binding domain-containing protein
VHPGRDRERGRIWRIVPPAQRAANVPLATSLTLPTALADLVTELGSSNRTRRVLAQHRLVDTFGTNATTMLRDTAQGAYQFPTPAQKAHARVHAAWALLNLNALDDLTFGTLLDQQTPELRIHAARMVAEIGLRSAGKVAGATPVHSMDNTRALIISLLEDSDAHVRRAAADALGVFPAQANVEPLLQVLEKTPAADTHLRHVVRMALRDSLSAAGQLDDFTASEKSSRAVADVALAVTNSAAASFLVAHLQKYSEPRSTAAKQLRHAARFLPEIRIDDLATLARDKFRDDVDLQSALFKSVQDGLSQRGVALSPQMKQWGTTLAGDLLRSVERSDPGWTSLPVDSNPASANPWAVQNRKSSDGRDADFLCTLPAGETLTGVLRSKNFTAPAKLTFWMAGHDGSPDKPLQKKNFVTLRDAKTSAVLMTAPAPRNDTAKATTWDLSAHGGQQVFLELVDSDTAGAYAWLAVGRFEPAVVTLPKTTPKVIDERLTGAAQIALATRDASLEAPLAVALKIPAGVEARGSVAASLLAMNTKQHLPAVGEIMNDASAPDALRQRIAQAIAESNTDEGRALVVSALQRTPERAQPKFALALSGTKPGAEALLKEVEAGRVSARLLQNQALKEKLTASKADNVKVRLTKLTANLTPLNEQLQKLIDQRAKAFASAKASAAKGVAVFEKNCAVCHQLDGKGALVGPQLDGVGARGVERIMEDVIDPNRNVDGAFRATLFELKDGETASGLFRREEGELLIYADTAGKEHSLARKDIKERRQSELSLMPEGLAEAMTPAEFNDLMAFLITKKAEKK